MAGIFLDANIIFDIIIKRRTSKAYPLLTEFKPFISPLTFHIFNYVEHKSMPQKALSGHLNHYVVVPLDQKICQLSFLGPTSDFEDNVQLHSAIKAKCVKFYTRDKKLIWLGHFSGIEILSPYPEDNKS